MIPGKDSRWFFSAQCPVRLEGPLRLLFSGYWGAVFSLAMHPRCGADHPLPSSAEAKNKMSCISTVLYAFIRTTYLYLYDPVLISQAVPLLQMCPQKSCAYIFVCLCEPLVHLVSWAHWFCMCVYIYIYVCVCVYVYKCLWAEILLLFCHHVASHSYSCWYMCHVAGITKNSLLCEMYE